MLTSTWYRSALIAPVTIFVVCLNRYGLPTAIGSSAIQTTMASKRGSRRGHISGPDQHVAAADVDFIFQRQRDRQRRKRFFQFAVEGHDRLDAAGLARRQGHHFVALADDARGDRAAEAAEVEVRPVDVLHRKAKVLQVAVRADVDRFQEVHQRAALVPRHVRTRVDDVVALQRRDRNEVQIGQVQSRGKVLVVVANLLEDLLAVIDQVHLVDGDQDVLDAQQRRDEGMPFGLRQHAVPGVDQDDRQVGGRGAGGHVARVLLVARRVGDDELALGRREVAIGHVDRDALFAFGLQAVGQQRRVEVAARRAVDLRVPFDAPPADLRRSSSSRTAAGRSACSCRRRRCRR